jgi:hypothetical protein
LLQFSDKAPIIQLNQTIGHVEIFVIVGDNKDSFAASLELGQKTGIEDVFE